MTVWEELKERGFLFQCTNEKELEKKLSKEKITIYAGFDPTASSLHIGHFIPLLALAHFGRYGHTPIILIGSGTTRVGDPSGKTEARPMLFNDELNKNAQYIFDQASHIMKALNVTPVMKNNENWLCSIKYIDFLRDVGQHFSVSRMLSFDTYKNRLEGGLSFLEFSYQLLQAYDFLHLYKYNTCHLQIGGADQWANIVAGVDLIRRIHRVEVFGYTHPLIVRSDGAKMGKTEEGAIFFDRKLTSVYDFYQYWRNVDDKDVVRFIKLYTFLPLEQVKMFENYQGAELNPLKKLLALTITGMVHGETEAKKAAETAEAVVYGEETGEHIHAEHVVTPREIEDGIFLVDLYVKSKLCASKSEARRLIAQKGARIGENLILDENMILQEKHFTEGCTFLKYGKKRFIKIVSTE